MSTFIIAFGLIIGSFLSACVYRIPLSRLDDLEAEDENLAKTPRELKGLGISRNEVTLSNPRRSFCPSCHATLSWYHNIPLFSWLALRGKCASYKTSIPWRYPLIESMSALAAWGSFTLFGATPTALAIFALCAALIVITFIDIDYYIIPNTISYPGTAIGLIIASVNQFTGWFQAPIVGGVFDALLGLLVGAGTLWFISEGYFRLRGRDGLGLGDVKLLAMTGVLLGWKGAFYTIFVGSVLGSVFGIAAIILFRRSASRHIPFGPYLSAATAMYIFSGDAVIEYWVQFVGFIIGGVS